jgi:flagellar operon protein
MPYRVSSGPGKTEGNSSLSLHKKVVDRNTDFRHIFQVELQKGKEVKVSAHAAQRLQSRNITLSQKDMEKITQAVDKARDKGARESLILYGDVVLIASIQNRTVITAMDRESSRENVFTNIDSAVLI